MKRFLILQLHLSFCSGFILQEKAGRNSHVAFDLTISEPGLGKVKLIHPCKYTGSTRDNSKKLREREFLRSFTDTKGLQVKTNLFFIEVSGNIS